ncbi:heparinase II/III domain-containing protein [Aquipuribacter nitratireducens]|uniref:Heparinase II/III family protein n=1 Tax=Aquipuribacter nitratireducens TaxID=650104 RepID=A0ABW0GIB7_9MICO
MTRSRSATPAALLAGLTALLLALLLLPAPGHAASALADAKAALWTRYKAAGEDYKVARTRLGGLPRSQVVAMQDANARGYASLTASGPLISAVTSWSTYDTAKRRIDSETRRARTVRDVAGRLQTIAAYRTEQHTLARTALDDRATGRMSSSAYAAQRTRLESFSTRLAGDTAAHLAAAGKAVATPTLFSSRYLSSVRTRSGSVPAASGWTGFAGGCALPYATSVWRPSVPTDRPVVATTSAMVSAAKQRVTREPLATTHRQMLQSAARERGTPQAVDGAWQSFGTRTTRLGYAWLGGGDGASRTALQKDVRTLAAAGPERQTNTLRAAGVLGAMAAGYNWTATVDPMTEERVYVRWLGPATCEHAFRDSFVSGSTNIPVIQNSNYFIAGAVFLRGKPAQSAAFARATLGGVAPGLRALAQDGGSVEGPGYWNYMTSGVGGVAALYATYDAVYGTGPVTLPSPWKLATYALNSANKDGSVVPVGDSAPQDVAPFAPAWVAKATGNTTVAAWARGKFAQEPHPYLLWWWVDGGSVATPRSSLYPASGLAVLQRPEGTVTVKGGRNGLSHGHLDLGSVSVQRKGVDWAVDPGLGSYSQPGYFDSVKRWTYWHPSVSAHSTLVRAGANQPTTARATFSGFTASQVGVDLTKAVPGTRLAKRTVTHYSDRVDIRDEVRADSAVNLQWRWVTDADVSVGSGQVVLRKAGQTATLRFSGLPAGSVISEAPAPETSSDGRALTVVTVALPRVRSMTLTASLR